MNRIDNLGSLQKEISQVPNVWLLIHKNGAEQCQCALQNLKNVSDNRKEIAIFYADVSKAKDIHPEYNVTSVPTLINFRDGLLQNIIKGCHTTSQFEQLYLGQVLYK